jgi:iron-sulfur cluster repair protein YtfE (RIC family)
MLEESRRGWRDPELVPLFAEVVERHGDADADDLGVQKSLEAMRRELAQ